MSNVTVGNDLKSKFEAAQEALKVAQAAFSASLPVAPAETVARMGELTEKLDLSVAEQAELKKAKDGFRFREEEKQQLQAAKVKRLATASTPEERRKFADSIMTGFIMDARRKLRADGRVVSSIKVLS